MGLTHYWKRQAELDTVKFASAVVDCATVLSKIDIPLSSNADGECKPIFTSDSIMFNGTKGATCENFKISRFEPSRRQTPMTSSYCKTEGLPYDLCVRVALIILKHHLGDDLTVNSDSPDADWSNARHICQQQLGYGTDFTLGENP